ncbi:hypothetical protein EUGRSUZ_H00097 [Eucalyptus grandis]|uniref:Uncharacterized protein n=2 Tax=Eucalyptus grandis TaxID=71139 RepID=A0ACC3JM40_EUCGR|nr:hypothetical protein EUGRSUZ_H00097 [Eucalyptus grandis]
MGKGIAHYLYRLKISKRIHLIYRHRETASERKLIRKTFIQTCKTIHHSRLPYVQIQEQQYTHSSGLATI